MRLGSALGRRPWLHLGATAHRRLRVARTVLLVGVTVALGVRLLTPAAPEVVLPPPPPAAAPAPAPAPGPAPAEPTPELARLAPVHVRIPAIRVDATVVVTGLLPGDVMEIPADVRTLGWYDPDGLGVAPGWPGTAVLAGHVDSRTQGRGALYFLRELAVGDVVELVLADGSVSGWRITEVIQYAKATLPYEEVFTWTGPPRLALITCGGEFDRTSRSYTDNIVAYAEPLDGSGSSSPSPPSPRA